MKKRLESTLINSDITTKARRSQTLKERKQEVESRPLDQQRTLSNTIAPTKEKKQRVFTNTSIQSLRIPKKLCRLLPSVKKFTRRDMKQFSKNKPEVCS